jgi:hypothetical protein
MPIQRVTPQTLKVLSALIGATDPIWGLELVRRTGLMTGTVYPILDRLEELGWLRSYWEEPNDRPGPRRRFYVLTETGINEGQDLIGSQLEKEKAGLKVKKRATRLGEV